MRVQGRRTDAFPTTWEIPVGLGLVWTLGAVLALPAGQGVAYALQGDGFVWPGADLVQSLGGFVVGEPGLGLSPYLYDAAPATAIVYVAIVALEVCLAGVVLVALTKWWVTVGPLAQVGLASKHEVTAVLGAGQLNRRRMTVRPDLQTGGPR